jgi:hypothetical protein
MPKRHEVEILLKTGHPKTEVAHLAVNVYQASGYDSLAHLQAPPVDFGFRVHLRSAPFGRFPSTQ